MIVPQTMFNVLSRHFEGITPCEADGSHGPASAENVRWLQRAAGLPATAILLQLGQMTSQSQLRAFVDNLPSASL